MGKVHGLMVLVQEQSTFAAHNSRNFTANTGSLKTQPRTFSLTLGVRERQNIFEENSQHASD